MPASFPNNPKRRSEALYSAGATDRQIVACTVRLLTKLLESGQAKPSDTRVLREAMRVFGQFPQVAEQVPMSIEVVGPRRWFGEREIFHWWNVYLEDDALHVSSGGHLYEKSEGCDTFVSFTWDAAPGVPSEHVDFREQLTRIDDAAPFDREVELMDLSQPGYTVSAVAGTEKVSGPEGAVDPDSSPPRNDEDSRAANPLCELCGRELTQPGRSTPRDAEGRNATWHASGHGSRNRMRPRSVRPSRRAEQSNVSHTAE